MNVKKIFNLIFEEVDEDEDRKEEVIVDKPLVRHEFKEEKVVPTKVNTAQEIKKKDVLERPSTKVDIPNVTKRSTSAFTSAKVTKRYEPKNNTKYVAEPFLSPINGVIDTKKVEIEKPSYVPKKTTKPAKNPLCTVLSPIYGVMSAEENEEKEIIEKDTKKEKENVIFAQSNIKPLVDNFDDITTISKTDFKKEEMKEKIEEVVEEVTPITDILSEPSEEETFVYSEDITLFDDILKDDK